MDFTAVVVFTTLTILTLASVPLWIGFVRAKRRDPGFLQRRTAPTPLGAIDVGLFFFLVPFTQLALTSVVCQVTGIANALMGSDVEKSGEFILIYHLSGLAGLAAAIAIICTRHAKGLEIFGWRRESFMRDLLLGGVVFLMVVPAVLLVHNLVNHFLISYEHDTLNRLGKATFLQTVGLTVGATVYAPVYEEVFYRGVLLAWLLRFSYLAKFDLVPWLLGGYAGTYRRIKGVEVDDQEPETTTTIGTWVAILVTAGGFGLMHITQGGAAIPLTLFAIALGYLFATTRSLVPCIVTHFLLNAMTMAFAISSR